MLHGAQGLWIPNSLLPTPHLLLLNPSMSISSSFYRPKPSPSLHPLGSHNLRNQSELWLAQAPDDEPSTAPPPVEEGPIELPSSVSSIFATSDDPTPLQTATSLLLTGAVSVFLFRSLRRRAKRAKELQLRSSGGKKSLKEEAMESLKTMTPTLNEAKSPSPVQALLGGLTAGVIALLLYKFTITIESSLNRQALSDNFSVRQITITIRTIINGICYLATFVFGINAVGLLLYSGQLAINSLTGSGETGTNAPTNGSKLDTLADSFAQGDGDENQSSDDTQL